jgi:hypothetical protein
MTFDEKVSRVLHLARLLEDLAHSRGDWSVRYGGQTCPAKVQIVGDRARITFSVPSQCWLEKPDGIAVLLLDGEERHYRDLGFHGDSPVDFTWDISVSAALVA